MQQRLFNCHSARGKNDRNDAETLCEPMVRPKAIIYEWFLSRIALDTRLVGLAVLTSHVRTQRQCLLHGPGQVQEYAVVIETKIRQVVREIREVVAEADFHVISNVTRDRCQCAGAPLVQV